MASRVVSRPNSSRRGCWTCKRHHRTCDEAKPFCERCKQYAVECEGYGAKRIAFRPVKKKTTSKNSTHAQTSRNSGLLLSPERLSPSPYTALSGTSPLSTNINSHQRTLLNRFLRDFAPLRSLSPLQNIFEEDIAPLALGHHHVRTAIIAVISALKQSDNSSPSQQHIYQNAVAFQHYEEAIRLLRQSVDRFDNGDQASSSLYSKSSTENMDACLAASYLLTWFEVLVYDPQKWIIHLEALCGLINRGGSSLWQTTFGRRLLHAAARLDCQNALSNRGRPLLDRSCYEILESESVHTSSTTAILTENALEAIAVEYCRKLHGLLGASAFLSFEWTTDTPRVVSDGYREQVVYLLHRLALWYQSLPVALRWPGDIDGKTVDLEVLDKPYEKLSDESEMNYSHDMTDDDHPIENELRRRSHLQKMILLHFYAIRVHLYHILDPVRIPTLMQLSISLAQKCICIIRSLQNTLSFSHSLMETASVSKRKEMNETRDNKTQQSRFPSDMPISFVFSIIGVVLRDTSQRQWISKYLMHLGREGIWCGYERALCLQAWWESEGASLSGSKRLIKSIPRRHEVPSGALTTWTPDMGMGVDILYENLETAETAFDRYSFNSYG